MKSVVIFRLFSVVFVLISLVGCGSKNVELAPVAGKITMNGEPLQGATVLFRPQTSAEDIEAKGASESYGKTDENGEYQLAVVMSGNSGAVVGPNKVIITLDAFEEILPTYDSKGKDQRGPNPIPETYNSKTTLEFDVPSAGADDVNFKLENPDFKVPDQQAHPEKDV